MNRHNGKMILQKVARKLQLTIQSGRKTLNFLIFQMFYSILAINRSCIKYKVYEIYRV